MNILKKVAVVIASTVMTCGASIVLVTNANYGDWNYFPDSDDYNTVEPSSYVYGQRNAGDTYWTGGNTQYKRHKNKTDSIYVYNTSGSISYVMFWGLKTGTYKYYCATPDGTIGTAYSAVGMIPANTECWVINYVKERSCSYACVTFEGGSGKWSPDCVGTYPICNPGSRP